MKIEKALVVDDSKVAHLNLRKLLTHRGVEVDWVGSGEECLEYLKRQKPDVVFMDVMMPGMDGFDTTGVIHKDPSIEAPPVVICSANATDEDRQNAENNGAVDFLSKPYTQDKLDEILNKVAGTDHSESPHPVDPVPEQQVVAPPLDQPPAPEPATPNTPAPSLDVKEITEAVQREAQATVEETARRVVADLARRAAEKTIRMSVEKAEAMAREISHKVAGETARGVAEETAQVMAQKAAYEVGDRLLEQKLAEPAQAGLNLNELRQELQSELAQQLPQALRGTLEEEDFKRQLSHAIKDIASPLIISAARETASDTARQTTTDLVGEATRRLEEAGNGSKSASLRANIALVFGIAAIMAAVALKFLV
jgi:CheY-like chemotaxis protein